MFGFRSLHPKTFETAPNRNKVLLYEVSLAKVTAAQKDPSECTNSCCWFCKSDGHKHYACLNFKQNTVAQSFELVISYLLCHNCLSSNYPTPECKQGMKAIWWVAVVSSISLCYIMQTFDRLKKMSKHQMEVKN